MRGFGREPPSGGYGGDEGHGTFGGRGGFWGRGDFAGRGDIGGQGTGGFGGRGEGRGRGGRRRGQGDDFGPSNLQGRMAPDRDAQEGTAAHPGYRTPLQSHTDLNAEIEAGLADLPQELQDLTRAPHALRPGHGSQGRPIKIFANHFPVACKITTAAHYDVKFENVRRLPQGVPLPAALPPVKPEKPMPIELRRSIMKALAEQENWPVGWAFDGKNIFAPSLFLPQYEQSHEVMAEDPGQRRQRPFEVTIKWVANIDISELLEFIRGNVRTMPQTAIQALDVAVRQSVYMHPTAIALARAVFFPDPRTIFALPNGAEAWIGYSQSLRPCENGLTLNVDMVCTAFLQEVPVPKFLAEAAGFTDFGQFIQAASAPNGRGEAAVRKARKAITGLKVQVTHMGDAVRRYTVKGLTKDGASSLLFHNKQEDREMSVKEYFEARYRMRLQLPEAPCLNVGSPKRPTYLPAEVCKLARGQRRLKLNERQTAEMVKIAAKKPRERHQIIEASICEKARLPQDPVVAAWGMQIQPRIAQVQARQLPVPSVLYASPVQPSPSGSWNLRNVRFYQPSQMQSYGVASFVSKNRVGRPGDAGGLPAFIGEQVAMLASCGMCVPDPRNLPPIIYHDGNVAFPGETLQRAFEAGKEHFGREPDILLALLPDAGTELYKEIKRASDSFMGVPTQCFVAKKASIGVQQTRSRDQYCANLALKINAKLDGVNQIVARDRFQPWQQRPFIVIGADVTRQLNWMDSEPSIAALVGSMDPHAALYSTVVQLQSRNSEVIMNLATGVRRLLINFYQRTGKKKPERIIYFRDGVSEGQFNAVQRTELPQIVSCCRQLGMASGEDYTPPVTFIACQKRHGTRLFPTDPRGADRSGNVLPGTVVDSGITHPQNFDFYLNSHGGLLGTSRLCYEELLSCRPAHYHVLFDQNKFRPDELQDFIFSLCFQFCRCTSSVSKTSPVYYANLAAARGRCMLSRWTATTASDTESNTGTTERADSHADFAPIHPRLTSKMFYI